MTDLTYSGIWKISRDGKKVDLWSAHPLLNWSSKPYSGAPLGVNDLVFDKAEKNIYAVILEHSLPKGFVQLFITGLFLERCCTSTRSRLYVRVNPNFPEGDFGLLGSTSTGNALYINLAKAS
jgi:hypothetical protein